MYHVVPVNSVSRDRSWVAVVRGDGALACACARARNIGSAEDALIRPHEGVIHEVPVDVVSRDRPRVLLLSGRVPWPAPVPAPGESYVVKVPSVDRTNP